MISDSNSFGKLSNTVSCSNKSGFCCLKNMTIFAATCAFFSDGISSMILCGIKLLTVFSAFIDANLAIFRDMANPRVAPVVLPGSRQHHFRSTALETSTSASYRRSLTAPQTLEVGPPDLRPFSPTPRDCSAAASLTARLSAKPPVRLSVSEIMAIFVVG